MKPGAKLKSAVCDTEIMVVKCGEGVIECGGAPMVDQKPAALGAPDDRFVGGTLMGKRYVDVDGKFELLCIKAGKGSLSVNGAGLAVKDAKPLPASD